MPMSHKTQPVYRICVHGRLSQTGAAWFEGFKAILDAYLGPVPSSFEWQSGSGAFSSTATSLFSNCL